MPLYNVIKFIDRANSAYRLPLLQRSFVWSQKQVSDLIDSLFMGFPIPSFVVQPVPNGLSVNAIRFPNIVQYPHNGNNAKPSLDFATEEWGPEEDQPRYMVLDGQQRLTSLLTALTGHINVGQIPHILAVDLFHDPTLVEMEDLATIGEDTETGEPVTQSAIETHFRLSWRTKNAFGDDGEGHWWLSVPQLITAMRMGKIAVRALISGVIAPDHSMEAAELNLEELWERLVGDDSQQLHVATAPSGEVGRFEEASIDIFIRLNQGGTPLRKDDILKSQLIFQSKERANEFRQGLDEYARRISSVIDGNANSQREMNFILKSGLMCNGDSVNFGDALMKSGSRERWLQSWFDEDFPPQLFTLSALTSLRAKFNMTPTTGMSLNTWLPICYWVRLTDHPLQITDLDALRMRLWLIMVPALKWLKEGGDPKIDKCRKVIEKNFEDGNTHFPLKALALSGPAAELSEGQNLIQWIADRISSANVGQAGSTANNLKTWVARFIDYPMDGKDPDHDLGKIVGPDATGQAISCRHTNATADLETRKNTLRSLVTMALTDVGTPE